MKRSVNILIQLLILVGNLITQFQTEIPSQYKLTTLVLSAALHGLIGILAHNYNPDGTPAGMSYLPLGKRDLRLVGTVPNIPRAIPPPSPKTPNPSVLRSCLWLLPLLCFFVLFSSACNEQPPSQEIRLAEIGREINFGINQAVLSLRTGHQAGIITDPVYVMLLHQAKKIQLTADHTNKQLDAIAVINLDNKAQVLAILSENLSAVQAALDDPGLALLSAETRASVSRFLTRIKVGLQIASTLVSAIVEPTATTAIQFKFAEVK